MRKAAIFGVAAGSFIAGMAVPIVVGAAIVKTALSSEAVARIGQDVILTAMGFNPEVTRRAIFEWKKYNNYCRRRYDDGKVLNRDRYEEERND